MQTQLFTKYLTKLKCLLYIIKYNVLTSTLETAPLYPYKRHEKMFKNKAWRLKE